MPVSSVVLTSGPLPGTLQIYLSTATLRLYEPPLADMTLISQLSESLTKVTAGAGTPLDNIFRTSSALRAWFDHWLSVPVSTYYRQPAAIASQLVYGLTMLGRWAKLATPRTMYQRGTPMPGCGSAGACHSVCPADPQPPADGLGAGASPTHSRCDGRFQAFGETEPGLPAAVGALQSQLQTQPGLTVNIPEILSAICSRLEQVNSSFQTSSAESDKTDNNIWSFSALKVRITRVKLERWAELVSAGAEASKREKSSATAGDGHAPGPGQWCGDAPPAAGGGMGGPATLETGSLAQDQTQIENFLGSNLWTSDVLDGIDPTVWFDGFLDWGAVIMNSMGTVEQ